MKKVKVLEVKQDENIFYVGKMTVKEINDIATSKVRTNKSDDEYKTYLDQIGELAENEYNNYDIGILKGFIDRENHQREASISRLKNIGKDINGLNAIFPNAIICNISLKYGVIEPDSNDTMDKYVYVEDGILHFDENKVDLCIIDGQHRIGGFKFAAEKYKESYEMITTFLIGLTPVEQAELFATINGKQKSVNKSVLYDLSVMSEEDYSTQLMAHLITLWFNRNDKSPLKGKVKMLGKGEGTISQAAMIDAITPLFINKRITKNKDILELPVLSQLYKEKESKIILQLLYDYLKAFLNYFDSKEYNKPVYLKSTGIIGLIKAFPTIYLKYAVNNKFNYDELKTTIEKKLKNFNPSSEIYGGGGGSIQSKYARELLELLLEDKEYGKEFRMKYIN